MYNATILDIYFIANTNAVYISTYNGIEPHAAIITHDDITDNRCIGRNKQLFPIFGFTLLTGKMTGIE
jgi:hypothetical protein